MMKCLFGVAAILAGCAFFASGVQAGIAEIKAGPIGITVKGKMFSVSAHQDSASVTFDSLKIANAFGPEFRLQFQIGKFVDQLYFDAGFAFGSGKAEGIWNPRTYGSRSAHLDNISVISYDASIIYKAHLIQGLFLTVQPLFGFQSAVVNSNPMVMMDTTYERLSNNSLGFCGNVGLEYKVFDLLRVGVDAGYQFYGSNNTWRDEYKNGNSGKWKPMDLSDDAFPEPKLSHSGITLQVYTTVYLPFLQ